LSDTAFQEVRLEFNKKPYDWIWSELPKVQENDWILCLYIRGKLLRRIDWLFADRVPKVPRADRNFDPELPYELIQIHGSKRYPPPPFFIDKRFREAARRVLLSRETTTPYTPGARTLRALDDAMR
jgi:hypothetical protein